jgi:CubicO group peptidase (beta-lactamase class C family)
MRRFPKAFGRPCLALAVGLLSLAPLWAEQDTPAGRVDRIFREMDRTDAPGCVVSVVRNGTIALARGYGAANLEYDIPNTPSSVFHVASISKQFTAMAVALLAADGGVSWDDDIRTHVPELPDLGAPITLRHLAHHTSGLRDQWSLLRMAGWRFEGDVVTQTDVLDLLSRQRSLNFEPGSDYLYSNSGFTLLAIVVERVSGQSFRAFTAERIFEPLGMTRTHFQDDHQMIVRNRAYAYARNDDGTLRVSIPDFDTVGATSLFTTVEDLARWEHNFTTGTVGGRVVLDQLLTRGTLNDGRTISYAFGLAHGRHRGLATVGHGGSDAGYRSQYVRFPDQHLAVAVLCNFAEAEPDRLALGVADVYLPSVPDTATGSRTRPADGPADELLKATAEAAADDDALGARIGYYRQPQTDVPLHLVVRNGQLATVGTGPSLTFIDTGEEGQFRVSGNGTATARFEPARDGDSMTLRLVGSTETVYRRGAPSLTVEEFPVYAGAYHSVELGVNYAFRMDGRLLTLWNRKLGDIPLTPTFADGFYGGGLYFTFTRGPDGAVDGFTTSTTRAWKVRFERRGPTADTPSGR